MEIKDNTKEVSYIIKKDVIYSKYEVVIHLIYIIYNYY